MYIYIYYMYVYIQISNIHTRSLHGVWNRSHVAKNGMLSHPAQTRTVPHSLGKFHRCFKNGSTLFRTKTVQQPNGKGCFQNRSLWRRANRFVFFSEKITFPFFGCISLGFWFFVLISLCFWCVWYQLRSLMIARTSRVIAAENVIES